MVDAILWPDILAPVSCAPNIVPFTRSGGRTLGGNERVTRTDRGYWEIALGGIPVHSPAQYRTVRAIRQHLGGRAGLIRIPVWTRGQPYPDGTPGPILTTHSDGTPFSDGSLYSQGSIAVECAQTAPIGATSIKLRVLSAEADLVGIFFSYVSALYETGPLLDLTGNVWTVPISPAIRAPIPAGATLEMDRPDCLCRLASDRGLDIGENIDGIDRLSVSFVEAVDYWSDLAAGVA